MRFEINYIGHLQAQQRPRGTVRYHKDGKPFVMMRDDNHCRDFKSTLHLLAQVELLAEGKRVIQGPLEMNVDFIFPIPQRMSKKARSAALAGETYPTKKPDIDNLLKAIMDAFNGVLYNDDKQVVMVTMRKIYGEREGAVITLESKGAEE